VFETIDRQVMNRFTRAVAKAKQDRFSIREAEAPLLPRLSRADEPIQEQLMPR